jgi:4-alpha-glucanotransferase
MPEALVQAALNSNCRLAMIPLQDLLHLGSEARMNTPGTAQGQWSWKFSWRQLADMHSGKQPERWLRAVSESGRS